MRLRVLLSIASVVIVAGLFAILCRMDGAVAVENWYVDFLFRVRGPRPPPASVVVLALDEASYQEAKLPIGVRWPRLLHAKLLDRLARAGVAGVAFDVLFLEPSDSPENDRAFAESMRGVPVTLGAEVSAQRQQGAVVRTLREPFDLFRRSARQIGLINLPDDEGTIRRFLPRENEIEPLAVAALQNRLPETPGPFDLVNFYGAARAVPTYSVYQVLQDEVPFPPELLRRRLVFVGLSLQTGLPDARKDAFRTPYYDRGATFGVEIHATNAANLLDGSWIRRLSPDEERLWSLVGLVICSLVVTLAPPSVGFAVVTVLLGAWSASSFTLFRSGFMLPGFTAMWLALPVTFLATTLSNYALMRFEREKIRRAFSFYLSPSMAREVAKNPRALQLGGREMIATAVFTDLAGFTSISESMKAEDTARMLNAYFSKVAAIVTRNDGTLIKFIGDAIFALWGAPIDLKSHARTACIAALQMQRATREFNARGDYPELVTRIGIHTGAMLVGNLGSEQRFDFTAIGDSVNLAARLEGANKYFGTTILLSESTCAEIGEGLDVLRVGAIRVVGKSQPIGIYTIFSEPPPADEIAQWNDAVRAFTERRWSDADAIFEALDRSALLGIAATRYRAAVKSLRESPPGDSWAGELELTSK